MYRVVANNPDGSEFTIYDPVGAGALPVLAPRLTEELNEAGSLEFALTIGHEAYDRLIPKATYVTAYLDGEEIFYGRLLSPESSPLLGQIQYTCAGALSLLQDGEYPADGKNDDGTTKGWKTTAENFFRWCINNHNDEVGNDPRRKFQVGIIDHPDSGTERTFQVSSYTDTLSVLRNNLLDYYGGFLRVRPDGNGGHYVDWVDQYGDVDAGTLELGENILSIANRINSDDLVTAIRPVGKDGLLLSGSPTIDLFGEEDMQRFGKIVKSVTFSHCETDEDLRSEAEDFVARVNASYHISSDIKLVDMVFVDGMDHGVKLGDVFTNIFGLEGTSLIVGNRSRDFENPQNDSVSLKSPRDYEGDSSGGSYGNYKAGSDALSSRSARNSAAGGYSYKYIHEFQDRLEMNAKQISINAEQLELHADKLVETANDFIRLSHKEETLEGKMGVIEGTGVIQNSEHITSIAGKFRLDPETNQVELINGTEFVVHEKNGAMITVGQRLTDLNSETNSLGQRIATFEGSALWTQRDKITGISGQFDVITDQDGKKYMELKDGTELRLHKQDGATITVGTKIAAMDAEAQRLGYLVDEHGNLIDQHGNRIAAFEGSALWTQRNNITGVVGEFDVVTGQDGRKTLRIKSGGGLKILRDNVEYGVYDNGSLTAGVIVDKINGGTATIKAARILLDGNVRMSSVMSVGASGMMISRPIVVSGGNTTIISNSNVAADTFAVRNSISFGSGNDPSEYRTLSSSILGGMIKTAEVSGSKLTLTRFDGTSLDFSSATTLSGAWSGSAAASNSYVVTASPQNKKHTLSLAARLSGTAQYSNFLAEVGTYDNNGNFISHVKTSGYLKEVVSGTSSYVDVTTTSSGGTTVARLSTTDTYNAGRNAVGLGSFSFASQSTGQTKLSISTTGKATNASKSINLYVTSDGWSGGSNVVRLRDGSASGTSRASYTVNVPVVSATKWVNTSGSTWRVDLTIGGVTRSSSTKDFPGIYTQAQYEAHYRDGYRDGWAGYYDNGANWYSDYDVGGGNHEVWIPQRTKTWNGSSWNDSGSEKWFTYSSSGITPPQPARAVKYQTSGYATSQQISSLISTYNLQYISDAKFDKKQNQQYRFIVFTVDGYNRGFYFV